MNAFLVGIAISGLVASLRVAARLVFIILFSRMVIIHFISDEI